MPATPLPAPFQADKELPRLIRGNEWSYVFYTLPPFDFTGRVVRVLFDAPDGTRTELTETAGRVVHAGDEASVTATLPGGSAPGTTWDLQDGQVYKVSFLIDNEEWAVYDLPVDTLPGGAWS